MLLRFGCYLAILTSNSITNLVCLFLNGKGSSTVGNITTKIYYV